MLSWLYDCFVSFVTQSSHAQRIILNLDLVDFFFSLFRDLEPVSFKVHDPRVLTEFHKYCKRKLRPELLLEVQKGTKDYGKLTDLVLEDLDVDAKYRHLVLDALMQMNKYYSDLRVFEEKCKVQVTETLREHRKLFEGVWKTLEGKSLPKSYKVSNSDDKTTWGYLGFQMPLTDFRKTGSLGLSSLNYMVLSYPELSKKSLTLSRDVNNWFPFSLTSINVTSWVMDFYNDHKLDAFSYNNQNSPLETFHTLHCFFFFKFVEFYSIQRPESVLEFNKVADSFKPDLEKKLRKLLQDNYNKEKPEQLYGGNLVNKLKDELKQLTFV